MVGLHDETTPSIVQAPKPDTISHTKMVITKIDITSYPLDCNNNNQEKQCLFI
jgi:hypothetical protein